MRGIQISAMIVSPHVTVRIDLSRLRENVRAIRKDTGVEVWPVVKADAYGLGAARVAEALGDIADGFCVFALREAAEAELHRISGKPIVTIGPPESRDPEVYRVQHVRPSVSNTGEAAVLKDAEPILAIDTGMQRFACPAEQIDAALQAGDIQEVFTHATQVEHIRQLLQLTAGRKLKRHAAATALLSERGAWLDAVRPGLACYRGVARVSVPLHEVRSSKGPIGYTGFLTDTGHHGVIIAGYSNGLRLGVCLVNGQRRRIMEVGMQSAYVELAERDKPGDEVVLLGDSLTEADVAASWQMGEHQALLQLAMCGQRTYVR